MDADWLRLALVAGVGPARWHALQARFGTPADILATPVEQLATVVGTTLARDILQPPDHAALTRALAWLEVPGHHLITLADPDYPALLRQIAVPPPVLYAIGRRELLGRTAFAIVGSRHATPQGCADAEAFATALSDAGLTIVSGLALGIDGAAHRGALKGEAATIAVVGTGLDRVYPARHRELAQEIACHGLLISEFNLGTGVAAGHFPRRNRIISGLSRGVLVVEASLASGSLITARLAAEQGRDVFALPGSIHAPLARGGHALIKQGAKLVENTTDILEELAWAAPVVPLPASTGSAPPADSVLDAMGNSPVHPDLLAARCGLTVEDLSAKLLTLELSGHIALLPGGCYQRCY
jgi:DNA processing protein